MHGLASHLFDKSLFMKFNQDQKNTGLLIKCCKKNNNECLSFVHVSQRIFARCEKV